MDAWIAGEIAASLCLLATLKAVFLTSQTGCKDNMLTCPLVHLSRQPPWFDGLAVWGKLLILSTYGKQRICSTTVHRLGHC